MKRKEKIEKMLKKQEEKLKAVKELYQNMNDFQSVMGSSLAIKQINLIRGKIKTLKWVLED